MAKKNTTQSTTPISSTKHKDKRVNIPTKEMEGFVQDDEQAPKVMLYPRDPSLDPQLVWKGKDEQDAEDLAVPVVPVYIQEKIQPQAIIENVRSQAKQDEPEGQLALFSDFNNIKFEDLVDFYHHEQNWTNRMILGDSLLVMTSLAEKEGLKGKVQMVYLDPPYGIKFGSNWQVSTRKRSVQDGNQEDLTRQPEQIKAFRDTWELGIHSYLAYLRDRLKAAHDLLTESGSIFVQIGEENEHLVRCLLDEVFGSENWCGCITIIKTAGQTDALLASVSDSLIWYAKNKDTVKYRSLYQEKGVGVEEIGQYYYAEFVSGERRRLTEDEIRNSNLLSKDTKPFRISDISSNKFYSLGKIDFIFQGKIYGPPSGRYWTHSPEGRERLKYANRIYSVGNGVRFTGFLSDFPFVVINNQWDDTGTSGFASEKIYVVQTNPKVIQRCILMTTDPGDLVLDPTCGSGTTAFLAEQWGRRWITMDTSRVAIALARTRLMAAKFPYYVLADSPEGVEKEAEITQTVPPAPLTATGGDIRKGFVYKRVPHITLKAIANNEAIDNIHNTCQPKLDQMRAYLNQLLKQQWEEWEIPREASEKWSAEAKEVHADWWKFRQERQKTVDASIKQHADMEMLYDQPYEENKRIRVTGPFTVESLSPHRVISTEEERPEAEADEKKGVTAGQFETMILENLRKAGVQNTKKGERLRFDRLEPFAGTWIQAVGEYTDAEGKSRRAAVCIGPEHGTVGTELMQDAARETVKGIGFDLLLVCGFAFDPHAVQVTEEIRKYGKLMVLPVRMNPDLAMGDALLKKTGAGNLFMVFGEPDVEIEKQKDGKIVVCLKGVDVYDPTTGEIRSSSVDDIACWFIDTQYDEQSFFVRHAYFTGSDAPYEKLKRALRAEINEEAWAALNATVSAPFERPKKGLIAVKVINHYGDEVLKVYRV